MDTEDYIESVKEQLKAYDFEKVDIVEQSGYICFRRVRSRLLREQEELVFITELESNDVDDFKAHFDDVIDSGQAVFSKDQTLAKRQWYFVAVTRSASRALRVATKRGSKKFSIGDSFGGFFLPVLIDLEESRLKSGSVSMKHKVTHLTEMKDNADEYFII